MRTFASLALLVLAVTACSGGQTSTAPTPPPPTSPPDAALPPDADLSPVQTPQASTAIRASSYRQDCTRDDECVAVFEGNACQACRCAFNAIHRDALPKYRADLGAFWSCHKPDECAADCIQVTGDAAKCEAGICVLPPR
ncbi:MAG: hypothetical protein H0T89_00775 [Deltaproteobacteria bacterium]|nr:hypothetical protein [Deltaproteobacteria bacterium]MDQ3295847.1 hypothetical protein [Myxococcota bacterium]